VTIADNTIHDNCWAIVAEQNNTDSNVSIYGNNIYNMDHGITPKADNTFGGSVGPIRIFDNHIHDEALWDTSSDMYHHDGIHCFTSDNGKALHYNGLYIYDNRFDGNTGNNMTANIFIEGGSGSGSTPCADSTSKIYVFNNIMQVNSDFNCGIVCGGNMLLYNDTIIGAGTNEDVCYGTGQGAMVNDVASSCSQLVSNGNSDLAGTQFSAQDYNIYDNGSGNAWVFGDDYQPYSSSGFSAYRSDSGNHGIPSGPSDAHSCAIDDQGFSGTGSCPGNPTSLKLNSDASPQTGSPVIGAGTNLTSLCSGSLTPLCTTYTGPPAQGTAGSRTTGTTRPTTGAWNAGAY